MSLDLGEIGYETYINDKQYEKTLRKMEDDAEKSSRSIIKSLAGIISVFAAWNVGKMLVKKGSDLTEAENKFHVVFESIGDDAERARDRLRKAFGRSRQESAELLGDSGDILSGLGFDYKTALKMASQAAELGIDLTSFQNFKGGAKGATDALTKAMLGESEAAKALGIVIRQDSNEYKNLVKHYMEAEGMTLLQAKAQTALTMSIEQSKNAIGDYARTSGQFANALRRVQGRVEDSLAVVGQQLIPIGNKVLGVVSKLIGLVDAIPGSVITASGYFTMWLAGMYGFDKIAGIMGKIKASIQEAAVNAGYMTAEAVAAKNAEELKTAENLKSNAIRRAQNKKRALEEAFNYKQEAREAFKAERQKYAEAKRSGKLTVDDRNRLKKAADKYRQSLTNLTRAQRQFSRAQLAANITSMRAKAILQANTIATRANATAKYALARAAIFTKASIRALWIAIAANPLGAILATVGLLLTAFTVWSDRVKYAINEQVELAEQAREASQKKVEEDNKQRVTDLNSMDRLKQLAKAERLNNVEKEEATKLISDLKKRYGELGISIDKTTGRLKVQAGAFDKINKKMIQLKNQNLVAEEKNIYAEIEAIKNRMNSHKKSIWDWAFTNKENENEKSVMADAQKIDALFARLSVIQQEVNTNSTLSAELDRQRKAEALKAAKKKLKDLDDEFHNQESQWADERLSDYNRELKAIDAMIDKQLERIRVLEMANGLSKKEASSARKNAEYERKRLKDKVNAEKQANQAQERDQKAELNRDLEYNRMKAAFMADGKLDKQESISLAEKEVELQKTRVEEAKKLAEEAKAANKAAAENALAQAQIELGNLTGRLADLQKETKTSKTINASGGFLATRLSLISDQNPMKETADNTKNIVKHAKKTEQYTKKIAEKSSATFS